MFSSRTLKSRMVHLSVGLVSLWSVSDRSYGAESKPKRNILFILGDDMGRELFSAYGGESYRLKGFDRFVQHGMKFNVCYSTPLCVPSRTMLMTGKYSFRNYTDWDEMDFSETTVAQLLKKGGYKTAIAGKWQLGKRNEVPHGATIAGFDEFCLFPYGHGNRFWGGPIMKNGVLSEREPHRYGPDIFSDFIVDFMKRCHDGNQPFFAYYCMTLMHRPWEPTPDHPDTPRTGEAPPKHWTGKKGEASNFPDMLNYTDKILTKLTDALKEMGIDQETIVFFAADNGTDNIAEAKTLWSRFQEKNVQGGKYFPTELGLNVPFFVVCPELISPGSEYRKPVDFTDILPTLCDIAQVDVPDDLAVDGYSLMPVLTGKGSIPKTVSIGWGNYDNSSSRYKKPQENPGSFVFAVNDGEWKLYSDGRLFNIAKDPLEQNQLTYKSSPDARDARDRLMPKIKRVLTERPRAW